MDNLTKEERSERMSRVRGKDTKPEMVVPRLVHAMGFRYRLHADDLPGKPDLVFPSRGKIIFNRERNLRNQRRPIIGRIDPIIVGGV